MGIFYIQTIFQVNRRYILIFHRYISFCLDSPEAANFNLCMQDSEHAVQGLRSWLRTWCRVWRADELSNAVLAHGGGHRKGDAWTHSPTR